MKKARLLLDSYQEGDMDDLTEFYAWLKDQLTTYGFEFLPGEPYCWEDLKKMSPTPLSHDGDYPYVNFYQV